MMGRIILLVLALAALLMVPSSLAAIADPVARYAEAEKQRAAGNYKDAYDT